MAFNLGDIFVTFKSKAQDLKQGLNDAKNGIQGFSNKAKAGFAALAKAAKYAALAIGAAATAFAVKGVKAAIDLGESINAVEKTFGKASSKILEFGKTAETTAGLSKAAFNKAVTPIGAMLINMGMSEDVAADGAINLGKRAADLASVFNTDLDTALTAIQAGLRGEADPLEKFGVGLKQSAVNAYAVEKGLVAQGEALDGTAAAQARLGLFFEQTNRFAGDFVDTSDQAANKQRILEARMENMSATIGKMLLPVWEKVLDLGEWAIEQGPKIAAAVDTARNAWNGLFEIVRLLVTGDFRGGIFGMSEDSKFIDWLFRIRDGFITFWEILQQGAMFVGPLIVGAFNLLMGVIRFLWPSIKSLGETFIKDLLPALKQIWDAVVRLWNALNPGLMFAVKVLAAILGALLIGAIWLVINGIKVGIAILAGLVSAISNVIKWVANFIGWLGNIPGAAVRAYRAVADWFGKIPGWIGGVVDKVVKWFSDLPGRIGNTIGGVKDKIMSPFKSAFNAIAGFWNRTIGKLSFTAPDWVPGIGGKGWSMPTLPTLALGTPNWQGGMAVLGEHGREAAFLPRGTVVKSAQETEAMGGQGGDNYYINLKGVMARTDSELADVAETMIKALDRRRMANGKPQILRGQA